MSRDLSRDTLGAVELRQRANFSAAAAWITSSPVTSLANTFVRAHAYAVYISTDPLEFVERVLLRRSFRK
jgi:hypothetical protein